MDAITDANLETTINTFSKEQTRLTEELTKAKTTAEEKPVKAQLQHVESIVKALYRLRSCKRLINERTA